MAVSRHSFKDDIYTKPHCVYFNNLGNGNSCQSRILKNLIEFANQLFRLNNFTPPIVIFEIVTCERF